MKVVNFSQGDDDWLEWRRQGVTATDAAILLGLSPYKTIWRAWAEKSGYAREVDLSLNPLVRHGRENESLARAAFEAKLNDILLPICAESTQHPIIRASLDGLTSCGRPVELKCPSVKTWNDVLAHGEQSDAFKLYYPQVQQQLLVTEASDGWLGFYRDGQLESFPIRRDDSMIQEIVAKAIDFWKLVQDKKEPPKDPEKDLYIPSGYEADRWITEAEAYRTYQEQVAAVKEQLKELEALQKPHLEAMKTLMGQYYHADYAGVMVTRYHASGRVNYSQLLADKAAGITDSDIEKYRGKASERCRVTVTESLKPRYIIDEDALAPLENVPEEGSCYF